MLLSLSTIKYCKGSAKPFQIQCQWAKCLGIHDAMSIYISLTQLLSCSGSQIFVKPGNTKGGSITVPLTSCLTGLDQSVLKIKTKIVSCHTADSKPVNQEVNGTVILPPLVFPEQTHLLTLHAYYSFIATGVKLTLQSMEVWP